MTEILNRCTAKGKGEQRLARLLESFDDPCLLLAFTVDFIPGCREIDLLIAHKELGIFIVEVKAVTLSAIKSVGPNDWQIEGRSTTESPLRQAYAQFEGFRSHWDARMRTNLYSASVGVTACLPEISRHEWLRAFADESYGASIAEGMIFQEDLHDGDALRKRLEIAMVGPPIRKGRSPRPLNEMQLGDLRAMFSSGSPRIPSLSDRQRLQAIERQITKELLREFPVDAAAFAYYTGHPGTGKTFRLLSIGVAHAFAGKKVLYACFNKTLASDIRRLLSLNEKLAHTTYPIDTADVFQLAKRAFELNGFSLAHKESPDDWGRMVVQELKEKADTVLLDRFDTLLIDEAHDLMDWQLELLSLHMHRGATVCLAVGKGQELYRDDSSATMWLEKVATGRKVRHISLRRNFRNTKAQYFAALAFHQAWPDKFDKVESARKEVFSRGGRGNEELDYGREGEPLTYIPLPAIEGELEDFGIRQTELLTDEYVSILKREIDEQVKDQGSAAGLLVLVPSESCQQAVVARDALSRVVASMAGVTFIDYTDDDKRRSVASSTDIRLCTFHSSRGLEGERVVIFGLENIERLAEQVGIRAENLAFITLSRALFRTVLVVRTYYSTRVHPLLKTIMQAGAPS